MTLNAITKNREWNTKTVATEDGAVVQDILSEFNSLWEDPHSVNYEELIDQYKTRYKIHKEQKKIAKRDQVIDIEQYTLKPNKMQVTFIDSLIKLREKNVERALLISSTG